MVSLLCASIAAVITFLRPSAMAGFVYVPIDPGDAYAPSVLADGSVQIDIDLFDALTAIDNLPLASDRGYDLESRRSVFMYLHGRDIRVCRLYANCCGLILVGVRQQIECASSWEWQRRIGVPSIHLRDTRHQYVDDGVSIRFEFLRRLWRPLGLLQSCPGLIHTRRPSCRDTACPRVPVGSGGPRGRKRRISRSPLRSGRKSRRYAEDSEDDREDSERSHRWYRRKIGRFWHHRRRRTRSVTDSADSSDNTDEDRRGRRGLSHRLRQGELRSPAVPDVVHEVQKVSAPAALAA